METNEIMVNDEIVERAEEIVNTSSGTGFGLVAGIGLAVIGSVAAYKYLVKPFIAKIKAKKEQEAVIVDFENSVDTDKCEEHQKNN